MNMEQRARTSCICWMKASVIVLSLFLPLTCLFLMFSPFQQFLSPLCFSNCLVGVFLWLCIELPFLFGYLMTFSSPFVFSSLKLKISAISLLGLSATFNQGGLVISLKTLSWLGFHSSDPSLFTWWLSKHFVCVTFFSPCYNHGSSTLVPFSEIVFKNTESVLCHACILVNLSMDFKTLTTHRIAFSFSLQ